MPDTRERGLVIVQIDGMSRHALEGVIEAGRMPRIAALLSSGTMRLEGWTPLLPPCTPASQAGILFGANEEIPGFRWFEKPTGRLMVTNHPADAAEVERRLSDGTGLLAGSGVSVGNLLTGDAPSSHLTMATMDQAMRPRRPGSGYPLDPLAWGRIARGMAVELADELVTAHRQRRQDVRPRMHRGWRFVLERVMTDVPLRILSTSMVIHALKQALPTIYVTFTGYDAVAHHAGPERPDGFGPAERIDRSIGHILDAAALAPRRYDLVVLSDHGQSLGPTFRQLFGRTLVQLIAAQVDQSAVPVDGGRPSQRLDVLGRLGRGLLDSRIGAALQAQLRHRPGGRRKAVSRIADSRGAPLSTPADAQIGDVVVCASGNLGLIYLLGTPSRMTRESIDLVHPGLVDELVAHPGIGLLLMRSDLGMVAVGRGGTNFLDEDRILGDDPVADYGPWAVRGLRRLGSFEHSGDIIAIGSYDPVRQQVVSFEELVGSHGGLGGHQDDAFIAYPGRWSLDDAPLVGAPAIHLQLRRWMVQLRSG